MAAQTGNFHTGEPGARGAESFHGRKGGAVSPPVPGVHRPVPGAVEKRDYRQVGLRHDVRQRQICRTANLHSEAALRVRARDGPSEWRAGVCEKPRIKCTECGNRSLIAISGAIIYSHLAGEKTIGVYPLLPDDTCYFLAVDVDKDEWREGAQAFARSCHELDVPVALEVSRPGNGAHAWIFFTAEVPARDPDPGYAGGRCNSMPAGCIASTLPRPTFASSIASTPAILHCTRCGKNASAAPRRLPDGRELRGIAARTYGESGTGRRDARYRRVSQGPLGT